MKIESYKNNTKITKEGKTIPLKLPLDIEKGTKHEEGGESTVWEIFN